jgi:Protein of unknown function (DUF2490)
LSPIYESSRVRKNVNRSSQKSICLFVIACLGLSLASSVRAEDKAELWPELSAFIQLNDRTRAFFDAAYALGKESDVIESLDAAAYLDVSLKPIARIRSKRLSDDWQRNRYLWARVGYDRIFEATDSEGTEVVENRGVLAFYGRIPLPATIWLETRTRADFRWIGDEYSNRYRFRLDMSREFTVRDRSLVPYFNFEWFYDTRYNDWSRTLATLGVEVTATDHFRYELYLARQIDRLPEEQTLDALGVVLKWYF